MVTEFTTTNPFVSDILYAYLSKYTVTLFYTKESNKVIADFSTVPLETKEFLINNTKLSGIVTDVLEKERF